MYSKEEIMYLKKRLLVNPALGVTYLISEDALYDIILTGTTDRTGAYHTITSRKELLEAEKEYEYFSPFDIEYSNLSIVH